MNRRRYLTLGSSILCISSAGCLGIGTDGENGGSSDAENSEHPEDDSIETTFRQALVDREINVHHLSTTDDRVLLDHLTTTTTQSELIEEIQTVTEAYADVLETDWDVEFAEVWVLDPEAEDSTEEALVSYIVRNEWVVEWRADEIDDSELMDQVIDSIETYEQFERRYGD